MSRRGFTKAELAVVLGVLLLLGGCVGIGAPIEIVLRLLLGWILYLWRAGHEVRLDWESMAQFGVALAGLTIGLHYFLRWCYRAAGGGESEPPDGDPRTWRWRWTCACITTVVMMFMAGTAMVGITHQVFWLATGPESIIEGGGPGIAARRMQSSNNLKYLGIGVHNYHDTMQTLPPGSSIDANGQALHGWQTHLLPFLSISAEKIDMSKRWDDPHNRETFQIRVRDFEMPGRELPTEDAAGYALSHYAANQHVIGGTRKLKLDEITDGTANTILAGEAAGNYKPWSHPRNWRDPTLGINVSPDGFGSPWPGGANVAMADGSIKFLSDKTSPEVLRALATPADGEPIPVDK